MTEQQWCVSSDPEKMLEHLHGKAGDRKLRLLAVACCRRIWGWFDSHQARNAVDLAERYADQQCTADELALAWNSVYVNYDGADPHYAALGAANPNAPFGARFTSEVAARFGPYEVHIGTEQTRDDLLFDIHLETKEFQEIRRAEQGKQAELLRDIFGNPFRPITIDPSWLTPDVTALAQTIYDNRRFADMSILADALEEAGCTNDDILQHCRSGGEHVRACWVVDLLLGKE